MVLKNHKDNILESMIDRLVLFEEAPIVYVKLTRFDADSGNKTSISHLIRFNFFITDSVDSLSEGMENIKIILKKIRQTLPRENLRSVESKTV